LEHQFEDDQSAEAGRGRHTTRHLFILSIAKPFESMIDFENWVKAHKGEMAGRIAMENALIEDDQTFDIEGYCLICEASSIFRTDFSHAWERRDGRLIPNWRENLLCTRCGFSNRLRAAVTFMSAFAMSDHKIYLTEQVTPLAVAIAQRFPATILSEFLRDGTLPGRTNAAGVRHEDVTALTFPDQSFDVIGTFDVLEHVPEFRVALKEFHRCLRPGGVVLMTVPLDLRKYKTDVRAEMREDGSINHLMEVEYHGDPITAGAVLCFYGYGWELIGEMRSAGFVDVNVWTYWSREFCHFGQDQFIITARRPLSVPPLS
jgi:SAM-dependent methyltransferase